MKLKAPTISPDPGSSSTAIDKSGKWAQPEHVIWCGAVLVAIALLAIVALTNRISALSALLFAAVILVASLSMGALAYRWPSLRRILRPRFAVLGDAGLADKIAAQLDRAGNVTVLDAPHAPEGVASRAAEADLIRVVKQGAIDKVAIIVPADDKADGLADIVSRLKDLSVDVSIYHGDRANAPTALSPSHVVPSPLGGWRMVAKDLEDSILAVVLLIVLAPVMALISLTVMLTSPGPVLFKQTRHGFRGQDVMVYKFRTMRIDAADYSGRNQTRRNDPRITRVGRFLRATSLDELPQLLNVIRGEMSIVGPRPHPVDMRTNGLLCQDIVEDYHRRHRVRPGITGWAQINGYRGATTTREHVEGRVRLDNYYIDNWSLLFDLRIMLLTGIRIFADENAF